MFNTILFPIDYRHSLEAIQAIDVVVEVVNKYQAKLIVLSVVEPEQAQSDHPTIEELLKKVQANLGQTGITASTRIAEGKPAFVICDIADELAADLIIMGSRGMSLAEEHPDGSVSQKVVNLSPCPVLVVP